MVGDLCKVAPGDRRRIIPGRRTVSIVDGHREIVNDKMRFGADPLDKAEVTRGATDQARLLDQLAHHGIRQRLAVLDAPSGDAPQSGAGATTALDQQQLALYDDHRTNAQFGVIGGHYSSVGGGN